MYLKLLTLICFYRSRCGTKITEIYRGLLRATSVFLFPRHCFKELWRFWNLVFTQFSQSLSSWTANQCWNSGFHCLCFCLMGTIASWFVELLMVFFVLGFGFQWFGMFRSSWNFGEFWSISFNTALVYSLYSNFSVIHEFIIVECCEILVNH